MKLTQHDIGGEIISILTKGMYVDPRDALREYVQNGVDASADNISIKIRQDSIVVQDDGLGMDAHTMRDAVRLGVSNKNPADSVGFMGIGLYSSFHLCDRLEIYSRVKSVSPNLIILDFKKMRTILESEREARLDKKRNTSLTRIALLDLLQKTVNIEGLGLREFPKTGTRVEMIGIQSGFFDSLSQFDDVSQYLEQVIPLPFHKDFTWGTAIEKRIKVFCEKHGSSFNFIKLKLQINDRAEEIFRPYMDEDFIELPLGPEFYEIKNSDGTFGIGWGCLNQDRKVFKNTKIDYRGFILKKQGFSIGKRHDLMKFFGGQKYFNRYIGEIIVTYPALLPNAPRSEFEYSELRESFYSALITVAKKYNAFATKYQENQIGQEQIQNALTYLKEVKAKYNFYRDKTDMLLEYIIELTYHYEEIKKKIGKKKFTNDDEAKKIIDLISDQIKELKKYLEVKQRKSLSTKPNKRIAEEVQDILDLEDDNNFEPPPQDLSDLISILGIEIPKELKIIFQTIDDLFIENTPFSSESYIDRLLRLKKEIEDR